MLNEQLVRILGNRLKGQQGNAAQLDQADAGHLHIEDISHETQGNAFCFAGLDQGLDIGEQGAGNGNDHLVDDVVLQTFGNVVHRADDRDAVDTAADNGRGGIDVADNLHAPDVLGAERFGQLLCPVPAADNEDAQQVAPVPDRLPIMLDY